MTWLLAGVGLAILLVAGDFLVKGAVNLSLRLGVPPLIVGLTIVAFGTSAPELLISVDAVLADAPGIAIGNVVGSNIANVLMVLGLPVLLRGLDTRTSATRKSFVIMLCATALFIALAFLSGRFGRLEGAILLAGLVLVLADQFREGMRSRVAPDEVESADPGMPGWRIGGYLALGLAGLPVGAHVLIQNATAIAESLGIPEAVIGLTMVAVGTSLPELATTIAAVAKRQADVALGNVIGSNIFNLLGIIGIAALVGEIPVDPSFLRLDLWVMAGAALVLAPFVFAPIRMTRLVGLGFCALYAAYLWAVVAG